MRLSLMKPSHSNEPPPEAFATARGINPSTDLMIEGSNKIINTYSQQQLVRVRLHQSQPKEKEKVMR